MIKRFKASAYVTIFTPNMLLIQIDFSSCSNLIFCIRDYLHIEKGFQTKWPLETEDGDAKYRKWKHSLKAYHHANLMLWLISDWTWICKKHQICLSVFKTQNIILFVKVKVFWLCESICPLLVKASNWETCKTIQPWTPPASSLPRGPASLEGNMCITLNVTEGISKLYWWNDKWT